MNVQPRKQKLPVPYKLSVVDADWSSSILLPAQACFELVLREIAKELGSCASHCSMTGENCSFSTFVPNYWKQHVSGFLPIWRTQTKAMCFCGVDQCDFLLRS